MNNFASDTFNFQRTKSAKKNYAELVQITLFVTPGIYVLPLRHFFKNAHTEEGGQIRRTKLRSIKLWMKNLAIIFQKGNNFVELLIYFPLFRKIQNRYKGVQKFVIILKKENNLVIFCIRTFSIRTCYTPEISQSMSYPRLPGEVVLALAVVHLWHPFQGQPLP